MDFVSPENIKECLCLTEEFRQLPKDHRAREDRFDAPANNGYTYYFVTGYSFDDDMQRMREGCVINFIFVVNFVF
ncbi:hypothetical protein CCACVL1_14580 [Corchorus capsularis]|uniref:Uncharacterized protein n=1 Tax=Corchorus capsularis TaxID=210143 RepID=A0A1R3I6H8_COCAP|nr:hypothetical protein CCACVL1_14580 [Corchorus capsularis]